MSAKFYKGREIENLENAIGHDLNSSCMKKWPVLANYETLPHKKKSLR